MSGFFTVAVWGCWDYSVFGGAINVCPGPRSEGRSFRRFNFFPAGEMAMKYGSHSKMPNEGKAKSGGGMKGTNTGATGGLKKSSETRSDVTAKPNTKNLFPEGLS